MDVNAELEMLRDERWKLHAALAMAKLAIQAALDGEDISEAISYDIPGVSYKTYIKMPLVMASIDSALCHDCGPRQ